MKKLVAALAALLISEAVYGQGTIYFNTHIAGVVDAPVFFADGSGPGPAYTAQLFLVGNDNSLTPLFPTTTFGDGSENPVSAKYVVVPSEPVVVPGVPTGGSAKIAMGAFPTSRGNFDAARAEGFYALSAPVVVDFLGGGIVPPANLTGQHSVLSGFTFAVPEPSVGALAVLGAFSLLLVRRA